MDATKVNTRLLQYDGVCQDSQLSKPMERKLDSVNNIPLGSVMPHQLTNSSVDTPPISSVYLEQGEYFFDDEFAEPEDPHLHENGDEAIRYTLMVQSVDCDRKPLPDVVGQFRSDSCIFSPVNSRESNLSSSKVPGNHSVDSSNYEKDDVVLKDADCKNLNSKTRFHHPSSKKMNEVDEGHANESESSVQCSTSGSTSWMNMLMERSCNPELRALINRTAAAVDYKLAYGDSIAFQRQLEDRSTESLKCNVSDLGPDSRSLSQGNLLTVTSLAGLRHALDQTTQVLPKYVARNPELCSVGVSADLISDTMTLSHKNKDSSETTTSNTTTWAKKHGSRESLKRRSLRPTDLTVFPYPNVDKNSEAEHDGKTTWQSIKEANGALITWNQLKRVVKRAESLGKSSSVRESRRDQHDPTGVLISKQAMTSSVKNRSHSQPISGACHMHRFSGTLLEIFMRARARGTSSFGDGSVTDLNGSLHKDNSNSAYSNPAYLINQGYERADMVMNRRNCQPGVTNSPRISGNRKSCLFDGIDPRRSVNENDKYLLLRRDKILPNKGNIQFSPLYTSADAVARSMRNFGAQFPPLDDSREISCKAPFNGQQKPENNQNTFPIWSTKLPLRNGNSVAYTNYYTTVRHSHPQPLYLNRPLSALQGQSNSKRNVNTNPQQSSSPVETPTIAACLTASAGPDSPYMAALRAGCAARGYAVGWIGNPRASIAYPGLGLLSIPRPSRLAGSAFLSHTLPDLSFLTQAGVEEDRKGTPTMSKRRASCLSNTQTKKNCTCTKCGCRSISAGRVSSKNTCPDRSSKSLATKGVSGTAKNPPDHNNTSSSDTNAPDVVPSSIGQNSSNRSNPSEIQKEVPNQLQCPDAVERSSSEPDLSGAAPSKNSQLMYGSVDSSSYWACSTSQSQKNQINSDKNRGETTVASGNDGFSLNSRPKKSVSFNGNIRLLQLNSKDSYNHYSDSSAQPSPEPKVIPRNWGLYGQEQPLAEFNPRCSPSLESEKNGKLIRHSDVDVRYHAMVNDVIKAVQETVAYYCNPNLGSKTNGQMNGDNCSQDVLPYSKIEAIGSSGRQPLLAVVPPLTILLCDGLLPPAKPIFTSRPRTRLWQLVEESCRPGALPTGVAYHVLNDAISQVKALTNITLEKTKFRAFICACLNAKALPMWLNALVANDTLLRRFYCEDAFIRQCRSGQRELHADLMTHLEQLLAFPFNLDLSIEVRKPLVDPHVTTTTATTTTNNNMIKPSVPPTQIPTNNKQPQSHGGESAPPSNNKTTLRSNIPPATVVTRRQMILNGNSNSRIPSASSIPSTVSGNSTTNNTSTSNNHCYSQHHLPTQRPMPSKLPSASNCVKHSTRSSTIDNIDSKSSNHNNTNNISNEITGLVQPKSYSAINSENQVNSQVRGRLKTAFSNLRRSNNGSHVPKSNTRTANTPSNTSASNNTTTTTTTTTAAGNNKPTSAHANVSRSSEQAKTNNTKSHLQNKSSSSASSNSNSSTGGGGCGGGGTRR
uniref:RUN domain-containing protein n=1 Tax=Trichobilharzia regenti TaxID=157069 RepID=A0AA85JJS0_TRIRE|nr:unnamed protein product [Trichobilharzia regenti]